MTDNSMDLKDAVRALKDRPSMELELQQLRETIAGYAGFQKCVLKLEPEDLAQATAKAQGEASALRAKCERYEGALREMERQCRLVDQDAIADIASAALNEKGEGDESE